MLDEADPQSFRVRAYESAAQAIAAQATDLGKLTAKELQQIQGIGKSTAEKIRELLETGQGAEARGAARRSTRASVVALLRIQGLGPKALREAARRARRGVDRRPARGRSPSTRCAALAGFGAKSEEKLAQRAGAARRAGLRSTARRSRSRCRSPRASSSACSRCRASRTPSCCGSLRRFCETVGDVDIVVAASEPGPVMEAFVVDERRRARARARRVEDQRRHAIAARRWICAWWPTHQLGAALLYFTGSKGHNIKLRQRALARGLTLNEYALSRARGRARASRARRRSRSTRRSACPGSRRCCARTRARSRPPSTGALPRPIGDVIGDFHVHTSLSGDGRSTLEEVVAAARARGCRVLAITDHAEGTLSGVGREALLAQRAADPRDAGGARRLAACCCTASS